MRQEPTSESLEAPPPRTRLRSSVSTNPRLGGRQIGRQLWSAVALVSGVLVLWYASQIQKTTRGSPRTGSGIVRVFTEWQSAQVNVDTIRVVAPTSRATVASTLRRLPRPPPPPPPPPPPQTSLLSTVLFQKGTCTRWRLVWFAAVGWESRYVPEQLLAKVPLAPSQHNDHRTAVRYLSFMHNMGPFLASFQQRWQGWQCHCDELICAHLAQA